MSELVSPQHDAYEHLTLSAALFHAGGLSVTPQVERLLAPLASGEMTPKEHEAWLLLQLQEAANA